MDTASSVTMAGSHATIGRLGIPQCASNRVEKRASFVRGKESDLRAGIAQRVGTGLRPGKLRKKGLGEDNKGGELTSGNAKVILMRTGFHFIIHKYCAVVL